MSLNNSIIPASNPSLSPSQKTEQYESLLLFSVGKLNLALRVESAQKILRYSEIHGSGMTSVGLLHIDEQEITVIDLHKKLFQISQQLNSRQKPFIILAKNSFNESFAIIVGETPTLREIPRSKIRILPDSYRRADTLNIASHVTIIEEENQSSTVFILDVDSLVSPHNSNQ
ncbi:MAG TPA: chemotaxis protein CheW [Cyanothece sp. UBA12306]|nr:chemotaxis protein CheW [Cyanothece sp. UBA12306]